MTLDKLVNLSEPWFSHQKTKGDKTYHSYVSRKKIEKNQVKMHTVASEKLYEKWFCSLSVSACFCPILTFPNGWVLHGAGSTSA